MFDHNNVFMRIIRKELPSTVVYEDDFIISINDIHPLADVHVLAIVKGCYVDYSDFVMNSEFHEQLGYFAGIQRTIEILGIAESGFRLITNSGSDACQEVPHFHTHILGGQNLGLPKIDLYS